MRRFLLAVIFALAAVPAHAEGSLAGLIARVKPSVVAIGTHEDTRRPPDVILGTGFAVGGGTHILTALHVVRGAPAGALSIYVGQGDDAQIVPVTQVAADSDNDMALLRIEGRSLPSLRLSVRTLAEGDEVAFTGFPMGAVYGLYPATHRGMVAALTPIARAQVKPGDLTPEMIRAIDRKIMAYQLDATSFPGNSGGPMLDPSDGAVVGVINSTYVQETKDAALDRPSGITFAMPIGPAVDMLRKAGLQP